MTSEKQDHHKAARDDTKCTEQIEDILDGSGNAFPSTTIHVKLNANTKQFLSFMVMILAFKSSYKQGIRADQGF